jgi:toxin-antitoxin system PIN domain toxin
MTPDINVLLAASRADHVHHRVARRWLTAALCAASNGARFEVMPMVTAGFLRLATNKRVFPDPMPIETAVEFVEALLSAPGVDVLTLGTEWPTLQRLVLDEGLTGSAISDAWIAAAVRANNAHLVTFDRGFRRLLGKRDLTILSTQAA